MRLSAPALGVLLIASLAAAPAATQPSKRSDKCAQSYVDAQRLRKQHRLRDARRELLVCGSGDCPAVLRRDCLAWLDEVEESTPTLVIVARAGDSELTDVRVSMDDKQIADELTGNAIAVDPGTHVFRFEADGYAEVERKFVIAEGEKNRRVQVVFGGQRDTGDRTPAYVVGSIGIASLVAFNVLAIKSHFGRNELEACKGHCDEETQVDPVQREQIGADVCLGVGLVLLGIATYLFVAPPSSTEATSASRRSPLVLNW